jgi:hypothetical protein
MWYIVIYHIRHVSSTVQEPFYIFYLWVKSLGTRIWLVSTLKCWPNNCHAPNGGPVRIPPGWLALVALLGGPIPSYWKPEIWSSLVQFFDLFRRFRRSTWYQDDSPCWWFIGVKIEKGRLLGKPKKSGSRWASVLSLWGLAAVSALLGDAGPLGKTRRLLCKLKLASSGLNKCEIVLIAKVIFRCIVLSDLD